MRFKAKTNFNPRKVASSFNRAAKQINDATLKGITEATLLVHEEAVRGIMKQSPGKHITRYNPKRAVTVSKPGDPPNVDFGVFVRSIQFEVDAKNRAGFIGTNDKRGPWFEFGWGDNPDGNRRPWLTPAVAATKEKVRKIFQKLKFKIDPPKSGDPDKELE